MNQKYGAFLAFFFLVSVGAFNFAVGISWIRNRNRSTFWGIVRLFLGTLIFATPIALFLFLRSTGQL